MNYDELHNCMTGQRGKSYFRRIASADCVLEAISDDLETRYKAIKWRLHLPLIDGFLPHKNLDEILYALSSYSSYSRKFSIEFLLYENQKLILINEVEPE